MVQHNMGLVCRLYKIQFIAELYRVAFSLLPSYTAATLVYDQNFIGLGGGRKEGWIGRGVTLKDV